MKNGFKILIACLLFAGLASAQLPSITALTNNYSYIPPGLPNYGIAQGSIFSIFGSNLSATTASQSLPLQTLFNTVSINVTVNGTTTHPLPYYVSGGLIVAVLPSTTPVGTGTITVTNAAGTSQTQPINVVQSAFGILTMNGGGTGMAAIQNANNGYNLLGYTGSAKPGDLIVLWGSGLGPTTGDESKGQQLDFGSSYPIEVDIGGVAASVAYHGRSAYPGLDEIIVTVPSSVSGCNVSIVVQAKNNSIVSNTVTAPFASAGGTCSDPATGYSSDVIKKCATTGCAIGSLSVSKTTTTTASTTIQGITIPGTTTTADGIGGTFYKVTPAQVTVGIYSPATVSIGSCTVYSFATTTQTPVSVPTGATSTPLNAGTITVAVTPTGGSATNTTLNYQNGYYSATSTTGSLVPAAGGTFSFSNDKGGPDIGPLSGAQITLGAPLTWTSPPSTVTRSSPLTVNWTGGIANSTVTLLGYSLAPFGITSTAFVGAYFWCTAPASAGKITVPSSVLSALPASGSLTSGSISIPLQGAMSLSNAANPVTFTAPNLDLGFLGATYTSSVPVTFQ